MLRPLLTVWANRVAAFGRDDRGTVVAEFVIMMPILIWTLIATFTYWDAYRSRNKVQKATDAIADALSRSASGTTTKAYIDGMQLLMDRLIDADLTPELRVSSVLWNPTDRAYEIGWSCSTSAGRAKLTNGSVNGLSARLPAMETELESLLLVETWVRHVPPLGVSNVAGIPIAVGTQEFSEFVPVPPRFIGKIGLTGPAC